MCKYLIISTISQKAVLTARKTISSVLLLLLVLSMAPSCTVEAPVIHENTEQAVLLAIIKDKKLYIEFNDGEGQVRNTPIEVHNRTTGEKFSFRYPFNEKELSSFEADSGNTYVLRCIYKGELFEDSLFYIENDPKELDIHTYYEENEKSINLYFKTQIGDINSDLLLFYNSCPIGHTNPFLLYPYTECSYRLIRDDEINIAGIETYKPERPFNYRFRLFITDQRSFQIMERLDKNWRASNFEALYSSNANFSDLEENKKIIGIFYYCNTIPFQVQYKG
jgi:hypothetical protein